MEIYGPDLCMPHTRAMGNGLFELHSKASEGIAHIFYLTMVEKKIVILHQFIKKTQKTLPKELALTRWRMKEVKDADIQRT
jgi:phage-related protein